jgi:hypothetical protein
VVVDGYVGRESEGYVHEPFAGALIAIIAVIRGRPGQVAKIEGGLAANQRE